MGAFSTFTLGFKGASGGFGLERGGPANDSVLVGVEDGIDPDVFWALPFFDASLGQGRLDFEVGAQGVDSLARGKSRLQAFDDGVIRREFRLATDTWFAGDLIFRIHSPVQSIPDPNAAPPAAMMDALVPAVLAELTIDNRQGTRERRAFFGGTGSDPYQGMRRLEDVSTRLVGFAQGRSFGIASLANPQGTEAPVVSGLGFSPIEILHQVSAEHLSFGLGMVGMLIARVPPGEQQTFRFAIGFHRADVVTTGQEGKYFYTRYFADLEAVMEHALEGFDALRARAEDADLRMVKSGLSASQQTLLSQSIRSYYGSTQLLEVDHQPLWVVNEGEYRMMNTFDLTVDHLFYELRTNPWTVKNVLDAFVARYAYRDTVRLPGSSIEYPGGLSFTHDMGVANQFSRPGHSSYEKAGLIGCFSYMSCEQLVNWILCGALYARETGDHEWLAQRMPVFRDALESLVNRDHPNLAQRRGVMQLDSARCEGGAEITTYDSLDASLGQARCNLYLAVKTWAAYLELERLFGDHGDVARAREASIQAELCAATVVLHVRPEGFIPGILDGVSAACILPAVEGLVFPFVSGLRDALERNGRFGALIGALEGHLRAVLRPGICMFADGGWKISSTSDNTWLSKIFLCQFVARAVLGWTDDGQSDEAHLAWLLDARNAYYAFSDQIVSGIAQGSRYYPRGVTSVLWLDEAEAK